MAPTHCPILGILLHECLRADRHVSRLLGQAARASYATYFIHPLVLTAVMVAFAWVALAPELKFVLVAAAGVATCFTAGYALTRVPGISKVL